jgi:hypothetical protein
MRWEYLMHGFIAIGVAVAVFLIFVSIGTWLSNIIATTTDDKSW